MGDTAAKWAHVSASQIKTFRRCARKWWFEKIQGYVSPPTRATELGRAVHAELEGYLLTGVKPVSAIALAGLSYLPSHKENLLVEKEFELTTGLGKKAIGFIDLVEPDHRRVTDHKTTSDFKWMKSEYELASDPQAILYCTYANDALFEGPGDIEFRHVYYRTRGAPAARSSSVTFSEERLAEGFYGIQLTVESMMSASVAPAPKEVEYNAQACRDYGGCPFRGDCAKLGVKTYGEASSLFSGIGGKKEQGDTKMSRLMGMKGKAKPKGKTKKVHKLKGKRTREQVLGVIRLLSPESTAQELDKLDMEGLKKLEKHLSQRRAASSFEGVYVNPPDGTAMDKRAKLVQEHLERNPDKKKKVRVTLEGHVRAEARHATDPVGKLPDGRNLRKLSAKELREAYWKYFNQMDAAQRGAWHSVSAVADDILKALNTSTEPEVSTGALRVDLRVIKDIIVSGESAPEGSTDKYKRVQEVVVKQQVGDPMIVEQVVPGDLKKAGKKSKPTKLPNAPKKPVDRLPEAMGGARLSTIKAKEYPGILRKVLFEMYAQEHSDTWVAMASSPGHVLSDKAVLQWVYDGCPDKHSLKRTSMKNALCSFLTLVDTREVVPQEQPEAEVFAAEYAGYQGIADRQEAKEVKSSAVASPPATEEVVDDAAQVDSDDMTTPSKEVSGMDTLYIGCIPTKQSVVFLNDFLKPYQDTVAEDAAVVHYGLIKYNEGPKRVAALLRQELHEGSLKLPAALVCDTSLPCSAAALEVLKPHYSNVVVRVG